MSQKPLCECNQGRLPCTCNPQCLVAQLQQDQKIAAQRIAVLENAYVRAGEREHELRAKVKLLKSDLRVASDTVALGASAEPSKPVERDERAEFEQALRSIAGIPGDSINYHATHMSRIARAALERKPPSPTVKSQNLHDLDDDPYFIQQVEPHDSEGASHE